MYTNYQYKIVDFEENEKHKYIFNIKSIYDDKTPLMEITYDQLKYMSLPYSSTGHSCQGKTIHEPYTIFDSNIVYCDRRWIWTALTRATI